MKPEKVIKELSLNEKKVLLTLSKLDGKASPKELLEKGHFNDIVEIMNASSWMQSKNLVIIEEIYKKLYYIGNEGKKFLKKDFPETRALKFISDKNGKINLNSLKKILEPNEIHIAVGWLIKKKLATISKENNKSVLEITEIGRNNLKNGDFDKKLLERINNDPNIEIDNKSIKNLLNRKNVIKEKDQIITKIILTDFGKKIIQLGIKINEEISQVTNLVIKNQEWKNKMIRPYDISSFSPSIYGGKPHPLVNLILKIKQIFVEMGFKEIEGNYVESTFWNMDVLFIPQDHPAREMQDTLYCKNPNKILINEKELLDKISKVHEDGGNTSSIGWNYKFSKKEGERALLRTHTTVNTIRYLHENPNPPCKIFSIGKVFRNENIDPTHLPEFYQIEGIIHEENNNFRQLIGILKEFYNRMGFKKIRFRPGYFPYTEPSMEVDVFWNNKWMELGGSGLFRPEVTEPVGVKNPVLAWGLGLERLAMINFEMNDMRKLYSSDLEWLRNQSLI